MKNNWIFKNPANKKPLLVLLATGGAGGKGTFISKIKKDKFLSNKKVCEISTDEYVKVRISEEFSDEGEIVLEYDGVDFKDLSDRQRKEFDKNLKVITKNELEWFKPENVKTEVLEQKIINELNKQSNKNKVIIVEGVHSLQFESIREMADLKVWIEADDDLRLIRKVSRSPYYQELIDEVPKDTRNFGGNTKKSFHFAFQSWTEGTRKSEKAHVLPTKKYADIIISSDNWVKFDEGVEKIASIISLYFENEEKFREEVGREKRERIENEIKELEKQIKERTDDLSTYQQLIQQPPK